MDIDEPLRSERAGTATTATPSLIDPDDPDCDPVKLPEASDVRDFRERAERFGLSEAELRVFCRHGFHYEQIPPHDTPMRQAMLAHLRRAETPPPRWVLVSGLYPDAIFTEPERRKRLRALYRTLLLLIRRALALQRADALNAERSVYWDPIAEVCRELEIAPSKLSALSKEFSGHSLSQVVDCVRAERVKKIMKQQVRVFVQRFKTQGATLAAKNEVPRAECRVPSAECRVPRKGNEDKADEWAAWKALKESRRWPAFCQNTWAMGFGFSTYRRMYRACLAVWKQTPHQLELALIAELLKEDNSVASSAPEEAEVGLREIEIRLREIEVFDDQS